MSTRMSTRSPKEEETEQSLKCSVCLEEYKTPKMLPCLHTFCLECLKNVCNDGSKLSCPLCKKKYSLLGGSVDRLPDNGPVASIIVQRQLKQRKSNHSKCEPCMDIGEETGAESFCVECCQGLCGRCKLYHEKSQLSRLHKIVNYIPRESELGKVVPSYCSMHSSKEIELFCIDCQMLICLACHAADHNMHHCKIPLYIAKYKIEIHSIEYKHCMDSCLSESNERSKKLNKASEDFLKQLVSTELAVKRSFYMRLINKDRKSELLEQLDSIKTQTLKVFEGKKDLEDLHYKALESFFRYNSMIMKHGTDCEVIEAADNLHKRIGELLKGVKKQGVEVRYHDQLKLIESAASSPDVNMKELALRIWHKPTDEKQKGGDDEKNPSTSGSNSRMAPKPNRMLHKNVLKKSYDGFVHLHFNMTIFVKTLTGMTGNTLDLTVNSSDTVEMIKAKIEQVEGIPPGQQRLIYKGRPLEEQLTICGYDIRDKDVLYLILKLRGS